MLFTKDVFKSDQKTDYNNKKVEGFKMTFDIRRSNIDSSKGLKCNLFLLLNCAFFVLWNTPAFIPCRPFWPLMSAKRR